MLQDTVCAYQEIVRMMPWPFAVFDKINADWQLNDFNTAFIDKFGDAERGQSVNNFPFTPKTGRSEIEVDNKWYSLYSFGASSRQMIVIMHDITAQKRRESQIDKILATTIQII